MSTDVADKPWAGMVEDDIHRGCDEPAHDDEPVHDEPVDEEELDDVLDEDETIRPINWNALGADDALAEWIALNAWVDWLRTTYGLPPTVVPPLWHRHDELVWELSALYTHWMFSYDSKSAPTSPITWLREFTEARHRLREWVSTAGCRIDRDRPTRHTTWPGETPREHLPEVEITDRYADFVRFVNDDLAARRRIEERVRAVS